MNFNTIIKNGTLITGEGRMRADLAIQNGKIAALAMNLPSEGTEIIDASGCLVMPGAIDVHVHLQFPFSGTVSADDFENGTKAAACGGVTTVIDFAIQKKGSTLMEAVENRRAQADDRVCIDYSLHAVPTDWNENTRREMEKVVEYGITSFKMFMVYRSEGLISEDDALFDALEESARLGALIGVHAESAAILDHLVDRYHTPEMMAKYRAYCHVLSRPDFVEAEAVNRAIYWAEAALGNLYIVHMSTARSADLLKSAHERGSNIFAETCPQYLLLNDELFKEPEGHLYAACPQLKKPADSERLWNGLKTGDISVISTDTCTFTKEQKAMWKGDFTKIPFGMPGVETLLPLTYTYGVEKGRFPLEKMVRLLCVNPAKLMGLYPQKGSLNIGTDADIVILNPQSRTTITHTELQTNCDWSPYEGFETISMPVATILRGKIIAENGKFIGETGYGKFLMRSDPIFDIYA